MKGKTVRTPKEKPPAEPKDDMPVSKKPKAVLIKKKGVKEVQVTSTGKTGWKGVAISPSDFPPDPSDSFLHARVSQRAYEIFQYRGGHYGQDLHDWFEAERQVLGDEC
jgi:hypothetical protein